MTKILVADDNKQIVDILSSYLLKEGYEVDCVYDGQECLNKFSKDYSMILLDVNMPYVTGFDVCKQIRETSNVPIIMITAYGEDFEKIMGLEIGADDYIVKPFSPKFVVLKVKALLKRINNEDNTASIIVDNLKVDSINYTTYIDNKELSLTKKEFELLWTMSKYKNQVFSREKLLDSVWGYDYYGDNRTVDSHIKRLRSKLDKYDHPKWELSTIWGVGYKLNTNE
jgi:DNA-binding response OmpR family regulator